MSIYDIWPNPVIKEAIIYSPMEEFFGIFNLAMGDYDPESLEIDYTIVSDNGDRDLILSTLAEICNEFFNSYPMSTIYIQGSNQARTRLYQMAISHYFEELSSKYIILGEHDGRLERFRKGVNYKSFLVLKNQANE
ncbi:MAG: hypothetical protein U0T36_08085 [Saprospiraceae bacterium]